jgi:hypothetical protein
MIHDRGTHHQGIPCSIPAETATDSFVFKLTKKRACSVIEL